MITFVILLHWWDDRECTGLFQWNDVYSRQTGEDYVVCWKWGDLWGGISQWKVGDWAVVRELIFVVSSGLDRIFRAYKAIPRLHDTTGCHAGCQSVLTTGLTTLLNEQPLFVQPVVKPDWQQVVSCKRGFSSTRDLRRRYDCSVCA